ncbi:MAG: radical SAM protein, partial [Angelakisella sp.]
MKSIGDFYDSEMRGTGLAEGLIKSGEQIGIEKYLVCSTATHAGQVQSINDFICEECAAQPKFL